ncbi:Bro-N domain-containing protein [Haematospirillum jordaniae]|uniref:BRO-N domain-containing protein n=1 Tax=Haematospirillum jordaniae TaxID=1549855 RepID=UPI0014332A71|nr:Bro-N domain-containing protein [Haematospirillum jordaniae]NKD46163.1 Bro-N domain-containing protein [Haematospirillum jordaniae]NKD60126.1 Bro-N domain-containing protein [Haematospirillum jordaniae]NKD82299.1 Bro-N domain-containing protein [Haematospirillum jordaniae]NKD84368.1 Bro-N domain-containing protein [Haematospirillum jordaniae]NKD86089.1 Bro-N domain-containing protein [Haematospirillum jordaniae]
MHHSNAPPENNGAVTDLFVFEDCRIRTLIDKNGEPWFVAKDVASILGYKNPQKAVRDHCKEARNIGSGSALEGEQNAPPPLDPQTIILPERDVYRLVMRSRLPGAERFENWIASKINTFSPVTL